MIAVCTDSNAQLPKELRDRLGIAVVPLTVRVDDVDLAEGVDIDADGFWARFDHGRPTVATAAPPPGRFLETWSALAAAGATEIVSVHIGSAVSATLDAARLVQADAPVPVRLVDTGAASFAVAFAAWAAADAVRDGADIEAAALAAEAVGGRCGNVFVVGTLEHARAGGRLAEDAGAAGRLPVLAMTDGRMDTVASCAEPAEAVEVMAGRILAAGSPLRVGVGSSDRSSFEVAGLLTERLGAVEGVEVVPYRIGPSVGAHTGPGTAGAVFHPL